MTMRRRRGTGISAVLHKFHQLIQHSKLKLKLDGIDDYLESLFPCKETLILDREQRDIHDDNQNVGGEESPHESSLIAESRSEDIQRGPDI